MDNTKPEEIEEVVSSQTSHKTKKDSIYKKILGNALLITILAIFCLLEIGVLIAIFSVFSIFYIVILSVGVLYLMYQGVKKLTQYYRNKKNMKNEI